jgi:hypothetical protein
MDAKRKYGVKAGIESKAGVNLNSNVNGGLWGMLKKNLGCYFLSYKRVAPAEDVVDNLNQIGFVPLAICHPLFNPCFFLAHFLTGSTPGNFCSRL